MVCTVFIALDRLVFDELRNWSRPYFDSPPYYWSIPRWTGFYRVLLGFLTICHYRLGEWNVETSLMAFSFFPVFFFCGFLFTANGRATTKTALLLFSSPFFYNVFLLRFFKDCTGFFLRWSMGSRRNSDPIEFDALNEFIVSFSQPFSSQVLTCFTCFNSLFTGFYLGWLVLNRFT